MSTSGYNFDRLIYLNQRISDNVATKAERDEYMRSLYENGNITSEQYEKYISNSAKQEEIIRAALTIGGIILVSYLLEKLLK